MGGARGSRPWPSGLFTSLARHAPPFSVTCSRDTSQAPSRAAQCLLDHERCRKPQRLSPGFRLLSRDRSAPDKLYMGNRLRKFLSWTRHRPLPGRRRPLVTPAFAAAHPVRDHPAVPALLRCPGRSPFHRDRGPLPATFHVEPRRRYPTPAVCSPLGLLPLVNWRDPPETRVLSARPSIMFGPSRTVRIPPPGHTCPVLRSPPVQTGKPEPSSHLPASCPKGIGEKVHEVPREGLEDSVENRGQCDGSRAPQSSGGYTVVIQAPGDGWTARFPPRQPCTCTPISQSTCAPIS